MEQITTAIFAGLASIVTAVFGVAVASLGNWWSKKERSRKIDKAIEDAVLATEQHAKDLKIKGANKYLKCREYAQALLDAEGLSAGEIILEAKIHAALRRNVKPKEAKISGSQSTAAGISG